MPHLWVIDEKVRWAVLPLRAGAYALRGPLPEPAPAPQDAAGWRGPCLMGADGAGRDTWVLVAGPDEPVLVNGAPLPGGLRVLTDRDEIRFNEASPIYFSTETLAAVGEYPGAASPAYCPRDKQELVKGQPAVRCPQCGAWYHESEDLPCWSYAETCALCPQPTDLEAGYRWTPEEL